MVTVIKSIKKTYNLLTNFNEKVLVAPVLKPQGDLGTYIEALESGLFKDKLFYGISQKRRGFALLNPFTDPGALYVGKMGSGKSIGMKTTLFTHLLANSENTLYLLYDDLKSMSDYKIFFPLINNVAYAINDKDKIIPVIEMLYAEVMERKKVFTANGNSNGVLEFEKFMKSKDSSFPGIARIILCIEEFHSVTNNEKIKFAYKSEVEGTVAFKLRELMKIGRSYGVTLLAATQKATGDDFPSTLKSGISMMNAFKVSNAGDVSYMGGDLGLAADLPANTPGRCLGNNDFGEIQYPWIPDNIGQMLINDYVKPLTAKMYKFQLKDFQTAFGGIGNDGMVDVLSFQTVLANYEQFNFNKITEKFLKAFDFKVTPQPNTLFVANFIAERDGEYFAVFSVGSNKANPQQLDKKIVALKDTLPDLSKSLGITIEKTIMIFAESGPMSAKSSKDGSFILERFELDRIADFLDNKENYTEEVQKVLYEKMPLSRKPKDVSLNKADIEKDMMDVDKIMKEAKLSMPKKSSVFSKDDDDE
jgi:hypothetical protein